MLLAPNGPLTTICEEAQMTATAKSKRARFYYIKGNLNKICPSCNKEKLLIDFPILLRNKTSGRASHCKECRKYKYPNSFLSTRARHIRHRYGLEPEQYSDFLEKQGWKCAICKTPIGLEKTGHVDHCHSTNKVRGILCFLCNTGLGKFKDNVEILEEAIRYLNGSRKS